MSHHDEPLGRRNWANQPPRRADGGRDARARNRDRDPRTSRSAGGSLTGDVSRLSERDERDLHFNGNPRYGMRPLHELCSPGSCQYKNEADNRTDLDDWYRAQYREPGRDDPEAEP